MFSQYKINNSALNYNLFKERRSHYETIIRKAYQKYIRIRRVSLNYKGVRIHSLMTYNNNEYSTWNCI